MSVSLGTVIAPSGKVLIVDPGYLNLWSHDRAPIFPAGVLSSAEATARANDAVDIAIVGADGERVAALLDRQWNPQFLFDIPRPGVEEVTRAVAEIAAAHRLDASLRVLPDRVTHRRRAELALAHGAGAGEAMFHGIWSAVVADVPRGTLHVTGEPMPSGDPDERRLRRVVITARDTPVARSERVGFTMVDWARILVVDLDALGLCQHDKSLDGLADFVFWGRDAAESARDVGAEEVSDGVFGWVDLPVHGAAERRTTVEALRRRTGRTLVTDFRPHSHHYALMKQVRSSATESGVVDLGGARSCGFTTTWGDGIFEVHRDLDAEARLVRIRIELGTADRQRTMRRLELRWFTAALVSRKVIDEGEPIRFMYREAPDRERDSGWRMFSGTETDSYNDDAKNIAIVQLSEFAARDKRVDALLDEPIGSVFERKPGVDEFMRVTDWTPRGD